MNRKDIVIGLIIIVAIVGLVLYARRPKTSKTPLPTPTSSVSLEQKVEDKFKFSVPEDVDRAELKDVAGGNYFGVVTRKYTNGKFDSTILADLADPKAGEFYEGWLVKDDSTVLMGKLTVAKGGYLLDFVSTKDYMDYKKVIVTLEKTADERPETAVLEGSFK